HMGHGGERARGDSRILDWPDAVWYLRRELSDDDAAEDLANVNRFFSAYGRDVDVKESLLGYEPVTRSLTYLTGVTRRQSGDNRKLARVCEAALIVLQEEGELKTGDLSSAIKERGTSFRNGEDSKAIRKLFENGLLTRREE